MYHRVKAYRERTVGASSTLRALQKGHLLEAIVAQDADKEVVMPLISACETAGVTVHYVESQSMLGRACGLAVGASAVGLLKK